MFMPLLTLNLSCENVKYPARKPFEKTNTNIAQKVTMDCDETLGGGVAMVGGPGGKRNK